MARPILFGITEFLVSLSLLCLTLRPLGLKSQNSSEIFHKLQALPVCGSVLYVAAHPDDENTRLISYLSKALHLRTAYLSLTRGDGGQNLIGDEQGLKLGLIRTHELLKARSIDGAEQYFTRAYDFGYSKNADETLKKWDKEQVLSDMVWVIRYFRPDVIICRFPTTGEGGHGHHTASAILAEEAFKAAADPARFSDQLRFLQVWQAKRLLWNTFSFGEINTTSPEQFQMDVAGFNPLLGKSYGEIAAESRSCHSSQAFGTAPNRSLYKEYFKNIIGEPPVKSLTDGIDISLGRFGNSNLIQSVEAIIRKFDFSQPHLIVPDLVQLYETLENDNSIPPTWKIYKLSQIKWLTQHCAGLHMEANCAKPFVAKGDTLHVIFNITLRAPIQVKLKNFLSNHFNSINDTILQMNKTVYSQALLLINDNYDLSQPHWLVNEPSSNMFSIHESDKRTLAISQPAVSWKCLLEICGKNFEFSLPVQYKRIDPSKGEVFQPLYIVPPVTVNFSKKVYVASQREKQLQIAVRAFADSLNGYLQLEFPDAWKADVSTIPFSLPRNGSRLSFDINLKYKGEIDDSAFTIRAKAVIKGKTYHLGIEEINYPHIPYSILLEDAKASLVTVKLKTAAPKIAYIPGAGDKV
ncbi:MAG: PIG-L family deacetylase, partial [Chitinophagales bacterium]|nr:PIG-L family deacetylase [Chitinophagales bacterium]